MGAIMAFGLVAALFVIPVMTLGTLAVCGIWNHVRRPETWQVMTVATLASFVPFLVSGLGKLATVTPYRIWLTFASSLFASLPVLVTAGLWALSRASEDGEHTKAARVAGSLLFGWLMLIIVGLPIAFFGSSWFFGRAA